MRWTTYSSGEGGQVGAITYYTELYFPGYLELAPL